MNDSTDITDSDNSVPDTELTVQIRLKSTIFSLGHSTISIESEYVSPG